MPSSWTTLKPDAWTDALRKDKALADAGFVVKTITTADDMLQHLRKTPDKRPFAVINPGGELFYGTQKTEPEEVLDLIAAYIREGGIWWETGGYSFYTMAVKSEDETTDEPWRRRSVGPRGAARFGFRCYMFAVEDPPATLTPTDTGKTWLGNDRASRIAGQASGVQRPIADSTDATVLVTGQDEPFVAGIRCDGWGWLWRLGGFNPVPAVATEAVTGTLSYLANHPWPTPPGARQRRVWEVKIR